MDNSQSYFVFILFYLIPYPQNLPKRGFSCLFRDRMADLSLIIKSAPKKAEDRECITITNRSFAELLLLKKEIWMSIQQYSKGIILANIQNESLINDELDTLYSITRDRGGCDVLIDFSRKKHIVTSPSISKLLKVHKLLIEEGHTLVLFNLHESTKGTFEYAGLDGHFTFADDMSQALAIIKEKTVTIKSVSSA